MQAYQLEMLEESLRRNVVVAVRRSPATYSGQLLTSIRRTQVGARQTCMFSDSLHAMTVFDSSAPDLSQSHFTQSQWNSSMIRQKRCWGMAQEYPIQPVLIIQNRPTPAEFQPPCRPTFAIRHLIVDRRTFSELERIGAYLLLLKRIRIRRKEPSRSCTRR